MTDKEKIMIDGVNVSECEFYSSSENCLEFNGKYTIDICDSTKCSNNPNCYFKQLKHKEQECEELKSQIDADYEDYSQELKTLRNIIENKEKRNARLFVISNNYRKALEAIEAVCLEDTRTFADGTTVRYDALDEILEIINKLKEKHAHAR